MMKLRQLEFAQQIARAKSFSQAADICNATQPTLSNAVSQLEAELGGKLFARTTRTVELTPFGAYLLPHIEAILGARDELSRATEAYLHPAHQVLRIGMSPLVDMRLLNDVLMPYRADDPDVAIFFKECLLDDLGDRLANGSVDIAVVPRDMVDTAWDHLPFYSDPLNYIPKDDGPTTTGDIQINALPNAPIILTGGGCGLNRSLEILFSQNAAHFVAYPGPAISYPVIEDWAGLGIGAGILPHAKIDHARDRAVQLLDNDGAPARFDFHWVWRADLTHPPHIDRMLEHIRQRVPALVAGRG